MEKEGRVRMLEVSGSAYERGYKYGETCKTLINRMLEEAFYTELKGKWTKDQLLRESKKFIPFIEDYSPEIAEELRGMADGSEKSYEEIVLINLLEEEPYFEVKRCTAFAVTGNATKNGETYQGQNWDGLEREWWNGEISLLIKIKRKEGPDILDYTNPGILASAGINSKGISLSWNTVPRIEPLRKGVPTYLLVAEVLRRKNIQDALEAVVEAERAGCFNFIITDETEIYDIEATPKDVDITYDTEYIVHANHYVSQKFQAKQIINKHVLNSIIRHNRLKKLVKTNLGKIDLNTCMNFLRDHVNYPNSICRHPGEEKDPKLRGLTLDSWVIVPAKKEIWIAHGPPCQSEYIKYTF